MNIYKNILLRSILLVILLTLSVFILTPYTINTHDNVYSYEPAGLYFYYPISYDIKQVLSENDVLILLEPKNNKNLAGVSLMSETEEIPKIMCRISKNLKQVDILDWIQDDNYKMKAGILLKDSIYPSVDILNVKAIGFKTDGLYVSDHVAFNAHNHIVDCSGEYMTLDDQIRIDFVNFISTIGIK
ncbi:MAG: hypothetical protein ACYCZW_02910 [Minisyncoccota bacterium]